MKNILVLFGGCSTEYEVSLHSAYAVLPQLDRARGAVLHTAPAMTDNARMPHDEPVHLALDLRTDNGHQFGIESKQVSYILLFHFRTVLFVSLLCRLRIARQ